MWLNPGKNKKKIQRSVDQDNRASDFFFNLSKRKEKKLPSVYRDKKRRKEKRKRLLLKAKEKLFQVLNREKNTQKNLIFILLRNKINKETEFVASIKLKTIRECVMYFGPAVGAMDCTTTIHRKRRKRGTNHLQSVCLFDIVDLTKKQNRSARITSVTAKTSSSQFLYHTFTSNQHKIAAAFELSRLPLNAVQVF